MIIDNEFSNLIPALTDTEYAGLRESIIQEGIRDALIIWNDTLLDGHNRYKIAQELGLQYQTKSIELPNREAAKQWIITNQLSRRNLTEQQASYLRGKLYEANKKQGYRTDLTSGKNCQKLISSKNIASEYGVSERTIRNDATFATAVDKVAEVIGEDAKIGILSGVANVPKKDVLELIDIHKEAPEFIPKIISGELPIAKAIQIVKEQEKISKRKEAATRASPIPLPYLSNIRFQDAQIEPNSIDLILTDPPYGIDYKQEWIDFAIFAERVLKPSGFLISYFGQINLPTYINILSERLIYYWTFALIHSGNRQIINPRNVFCGWKPILIFQKKPFTISSRRMDDIIVGSGEEKELHDWQQGFAEIESLINIFTIENEIILDPFAGSGTTIIAALKYNRKAIGFEINKESYLIAKNRIEDFTNDK